MSFAKFWPNKLVTHMEILISNPTYDEPIIPTFVHFRSLEQLSLPWYLELNIQSLLRRLRDFQYSAVCKKKQICLSFWTQYYVKDVYFTNIMTQYDMKRNCSIIISPQGCSFPLRVALLWCHLSVEGCETSQWRHTNAMAFYIAEISLFPKVIRVNSKGRKSTGGSALKIVSQT